MSKKQTTHQERAAENVASGPVREFREELAALVEKHGFRRMHGWDTGAVYVTDKQEREHLVWPPDRT